MQMEVHVHGTAFLCKGVHLSQVDEALREWLDYLEVETIAKVHSIEREEPGVRFDSKEQTLEICWTGMVGRNFQNHLKETFRSSALLLSMHPKSRSPIITTAEKRSSSKSS